MITLSDGLTITGEASTAHVNLNNEWQQIIVVKTIDDISSRFIQATSFEYGGMKYQTNGLIRTFEDNTLWLSFKESELIVDEVQPLKDKIEELEKENTMLKVQNTALTEQVDFHENVIAEIIVATMP